MRRQRRIASVFFLIAGLSPAARLTRPAEQAFDRYIGTVEMRFVRQHTTPGACVAMEKRPEPVSGSVWVEPVHDGTWAVPGGRMHHWRAAALVPGVSAQDLMALLRDYNHLSRYYAPEVVSSHVLPGNETGTRLAMRFKKQQVVTVVLDAEFETESGFAGGCGYSTSRSTHMWQVDQPGTPKEHRRREGDDDGYLWRLNSYWSFEQRREGLLVECEAVSLTRDIPAGLGWLITPIIENLPRASLEFTLTATRNALQTHAMRSHPDDRRN